MKFISCYDNYIDQPFINQYKSIVIVNIKNIKVFK
jgi:hypothetical protein